MTGRFLHLHKSGWNWKRLGFQSYHVCSSSTSWRSYLLQFSRNPLSPAAQGYPGGQDHLIDLHGLHVTEAIHVLNREFPILRSRARPAGQRLRVMICVGAGQHTKGTRTPARLPVAVERYLVEEGLPYTQPEPSECVCYLSSIGQTSFRRAHFCVILTPLLSRL